MAPRLSSGFEPVAGQKACALSSCESLTLSLAWDLDGVIFDCALPFLSLMSGGNLGGESGERER